MEGGKKGKAWQTRVRNWKAQRLKQKNLGLIPSTSRWSLETKTAYWFYWMAKSGKTKKGIWKRKSCKTSWIWKEG
jgi:hypothetical protein